MKKLLSSPSAQFRRDVFPRELEEIRKRRKRLDLPDIPPERVPSTELGLVGLALSGGGIRSATFSLGVTQALAKHGRLKTVDYLSTVSGGGFIGSCLSSVLNAKDTGPEQDRFPLHYNVGAEEPLGVGQLRNSACYLAPGRFPGRGSDTSPGVTRCAQQSVHLPAHHLRAGAGNRGCLRSGATLEPVVRISGVGWLDGLPRDGHRLSCHRPLAAGRVDLDPAQFLGDGVFGGTALRVIRRIPDTRVHLR